MVQEGNEENGVKEENEELKPTEEGEGTQEETEAEEKSEPKELSMHELADIIEQQMAQKPKERSLENLRTVGLYGDIEEEKVADVIAGLLSLHYLGKPKSGDELAEGEEPEPGKRIDLYISTYGGSADDMASLVDVMNVVKKDCPIRTIGIGKVMSAGVLVLASGTKGERLIGKNCRVMIHSVIGGSMGALHNLENELDQIKKMQEVYLDSLVEATNMTKKQLKSYMRRKTNVYLTAEEAIKHGIADKILE